MKGLAHRSPWIIALTGLATLAVAMGIGRFAFTPILPMMQADHGVTVAQGGWLASANYIGYLVGSLGAMHARMHPRTAIRIGLAVIGVCTLAMGLSHDFTAWLVLRAIPGIASAWVLVFISAWILQHLAHAGRNDLSGTVYAGVGAGIVFAGLACLALSHFAASSDFAWVSLGVTTLVVTALVWRIVGDDAVAAASAAPVGQSPGRIPEFWRLVFCYG